jgi:Tol biopolymer transport system component
MQGKRIVTVALIMTAPLAGPLAAQPGITAEQAVAMRQLSTVRISPDGKRVAYVVTTSDLKESSKNADIWVVSAQGGEPVRLTNHKAADDQPAWSPDGKWIAFISARDGKPQLYRISPNGGEAEKLTDSKTGVQAIEWAPDSKRIAFVAVRDATADEDRKVQEKDDAIEVDRNFVPARLSVYDVAARTSKEIVKGDYQIIQMAWSPDSSRIAYTTMPTTHGQFWF